MLSRAIVTAGAHLDPNVPTIQEAYAAEGGVPTALVDILVLSETLEKRVRAGYHRHLAQESPHAAIRETLEAIVAEMEAKHGAEHAGWIEQALDQLESGAGRGRAPEVAGGRSRRGRAHRAQS